MKIWVLILGGSTGHGAAVAKKVSKTRLWYNCVSF